MSFTRNISNKYEKQLLDTTTKTRLDALKIASKKVTREFIGKKIAHKVVKPKPIPEANSNDIEETIIPPEKREEILKELIQVLQNGPLKNF